MEELIHPLTGETINLDTDSLIRCHDNLLTAEHSLAALRREIAGRLASQTEGGRTRYLRGEKLRCKIEMPEDSWSQTILKYAYENCPQYREAFLRITTLAVNLREYRKAETGPEAFEAFKDLLRQANRGPTGTPRVTLIEE